ncbi:MAG: spore coat protein [Myxococcales bacterium]|nr:spore coat protein [Myxococcales bacterium]MCB9735375.1 spore coat protein [Deltaproteobacteria bacterium]
MKRSHAESLLYVALETEKGGLKLYETALRAARNPGLREEWQGYLEETQTHHDKLVAILKGLELDPGKSVPAQAVVRHKGQSLVKAIQLAMDTLSAEEAELVAAECVVEAESKDHLNWSLLEHLADEGPKDFAKAIREAVDEILPQEAHHRFHTEGYARELWLKHLGLPAALPPPEEEKSVETKIGAGRAEKARQDYVS